MGHFSSCASAQPYHSITSNRLPNYRVSPSTLHSATCLASHTKFKPQLLSSVLYSCPRLFTPAPKLVTPQPNPDSLPIVPTLCETCLSILSIDLLCSETRLTACRELLDHRIASQESTEDGTHTAPMVIPLLVLRKIMALSQMAMHEQTECWVAHNISI